MSRSWVANVRTHLRKVSSSGHSHAVSMWAWPMAVISCVRVALRRSVSSGARIARAGDQVARSAASHVLQKRLSSRSSSPRQASSTPGSPISATRTSRSQESAHASRSKRASAQRSRRNGGAGATASWGWGCSSDHPKSPLQAISTLALNDSPAAARSVSIASARTYAPPLTSPWTGSPSSHNVASELVTSRRSTCSPSHSAGTRACTASHHVDHSGPSAMPGVASRYSSAAASAAGMRPTGPAIRMPSGARASACTSSLARRATWRTRSRV